MDLAVKGRQRLTLGNFYFIDLLLNPKMPAYDKDHDLIRLVVSGKESALREVYEVYGQRMYAYALRVTGDPDTAEEVVQESLISVWQGAGKFRGESRVLTWLLGIVHHKALNQVRKREDEPLEENQQDLLTNDPQLDEQVASSEQWRLVRAGLESLSPEHRSVLDLVFYQGLTLKEAAEVCNCPVGTIKSRLNYAKASLRGALSRGRFNPEDFEE